MTKERLVQFDILKGMGILLVLFGHSDLPQLAIEWIYGFHMPLFFLCSGIFYKNTPLRETVKKCIKQLMIPWLLFVVVWNVAFLIVQTSSGNISTSFDIIFHNLSLLDENSFWYKTIWFLPCLFIVRIMYAIMQKITEKQSLNLLMGGVIYIIGNQLITLPLFLDTALSVYIFYVIGYWFFKSDMYKQKVMPIIPIAILVLYTVFIAIVHPVVDIKYNVFPWYLIFISIPVIYALYQVCLYMSSYSNIFVKFLADCGFKSITLFGLHRPLWLFVYPICLKLHLNTVLFIAVEMISALIIILPVHNLICKYAPILIGQKRK